MPTHPRSAPSPPLRVESTRQANTCVIKLVGDLDLASAPHAEGEIGAALTDTHEVIVVDLSELAFIDSSGITALLRLEARSRADSDRLVFLRGTPAVQRVLALCGVDGQLKFLD
jgi:anti-sigma B factor antagonist